MYWLNLSALRNTDAGLVRILPDRSPARSEFTGYFIIGRVYIQYIVYHIVWYIMPCLAMPCHGMIWYRGWECWSHQESIGICLNETLDFCDLNVIVCIFERKIINASTYNRVLSIMWCFVQQSGGDGDRAMVVAKAVIIGNPNPNIKRCCILQAFTLFGSSINIDRLSIRHIKPYIVNPLLPRNRRHLLASNNFSISHLT